MSDAAITTLVSGVVTVVTVLGGVITLWLKLKYAAEKAEEAAVKAEMVENKLDENTRVSREAKDAAQVAVQKLNGGLDAALEASIKPMRDALQDHVFQDSEFMEHVKKEFEELKRRR